MTSDQGESPAASGFRMPAEWHPHRATWLAWPHNEDTWPHNLADAQAEFVLLAETIGRGETVCVIGGGPALDQAKNRLAHIRDLELFDIPTNDAWIRDHGPTFVVNQQRQQTAAVTWQYNGWGEKYPPFDLDVQVSRRIATQAGLKSFACNLVVEGGALEINEAGELLTTISCLLNYNRNPVPGTVRPDQQIPVEKFNWYQDTFSGLLAGMLGARSVAWLSGAELAGDDTDGHIDQQVRFANNDCVLLARGHSPDDPQDHQLRRTIDELRTTFSEQGRVLQGMDLPLPPPLTLHGRILPASYLNFYICNYAVIVPQFDNPLADARAMDVIKSAFPGRRIIGLPSINLTVGLGSFHCLTQQEPVPTAVPVDSDAKRD